MNENSETTEDKKEETLLSTENFSDELLDIVVEHHKGCYTILKIKAKPEILAEGKKDAVKKISREASVPGFRKGKVPSDMVLKKFPDLVAQKHKDEAANVAFNRALPLTGLKLSTSSSRVNYDAPTFDEKEGAEFTFAFECEPKVPKIDYAKLEKPQVNREIIDEKKVEQTIEHIRSFFGSKNEVTDRAVEMGDYVVVNIDDLDSDPPSRAFTAQGLTVSEEGMSEWIRELIIGMKVGDTKEGTSRADATDSEEVKAEFKQKKCKLELTKIEKVELPAIDDELAKRVGAESLEQMRVRLKDLLTKQSEEQYKNEVREVVSKQIIDKFPFEIPHSIVSQEVQSRVQMMFQNPQFQQGWAKKTEDEQKAFHAQLIEQASQSLALFFLCREVVMENKIKIELEKDNSAPPSNVLESMFTLKPQNDISEMNEEEKSQELSRQMLIKAQDFVADKIA